ncbi:MAG: PD-(D/E)XK nuclease family protein [Candidatus Pacebacteria bacterium]|nr:PD-(D/E)XK nuclease family protein [Candidatus Paceibacterota bacterium]
MVKIAEREFDEKLKNIKANGGKLYSISKCNTIDGCQYEAFLTYIKHIKGKDNCYSLLGTKTHDTLQAIIDGTATEKDLTPALQSELDDLDILGISFPKDRNGGDGIKDRWIADMSHFCNSFIKPKGEFETEQLCIYKISDTRYVQGYIDLIKHNKDGTISIYDWKTSSQFASKDLTHHGRQLAIYKAAKEEEGYKVKTTAWIMLKYASVSYMGKSRCNSKKETLQTKIIERSKIVQELAPDIEYRLQNSGYDELDIECMIHQSLENNSLNNLPESIKNAYTIKPYVRKYDVTKDIEEEAINYINSQADLFESKSDMEDEWSHRNFTRKLKSGKEIEDTFYCNCLCGHGNMCKYIKEHNDLRESKQFDDESGLF